MPYLKMYPAGNGDAFLIREHEPNPTAILIDGGYASTFQSFISPDLINLAQLGYSLNMVISTHIDADHISGLLTFFKLNGNSQHPKITQVKNVWHNSLRSLATTTVVDENTNSDDKDLLLEIRRRGYPLPAEPNEKSVEISARQGSSLAALLLGGDYCWNNGDGTRSINSADTSPVELQSDVRLCVIGPPLPRFKQLHQQWLAELRRMGFTGKIGTNDAFDDAFEFLSAFEDLRSNVRVEPTPLSSSSNQCLDEIYTADKSIVNGSSISVIIEIGSSNLLFLGDSWAEDIESVLLTLQHITLPMKFDAIKISHHGSLHNTSPALLDLIDSPVYLISSNGNRHNHPDIEVLKAIVDRPSQFHRHLYFNYSTPASRQMRNYTSRSGTAFSIHEDSTDWIKIAGGNL
ncbi:MAG: MBL fold metallo-hydrolase [Candidatus Electrothrix sp. AW1]|nr:MBL fold metallo-hydrolase [Candidatus Electrothrix sp. AX1]MCI5183395.1 MBL fold metallo-hydrolase [Candidatus Electrothrix gigas]